MAATSGPTASLDVADVLAGDPCPVGGEPLELARGIEIGHIFQLGRRYAEALGLTVQGPDGVPITVTMGSYGIGVSRAVAAIAETTADELGLCWPREVAPADVHVVIAGKPGGEQWPAASAWPRSWRRPGSGSCWTTGTPCRPGSSSRTPSCSASRRSSSSAGASPKA